VFTGAPIPYWIALRIKSSTSPMVPNSLDGSRVVIQNPLYFRKIRDSGLGTPFFGQGETVFDSPRPAVRAVMHGTV
jgi:hypothetical protein